MAKKTESSGLLWLLGGAAALWLLNRYNAALESDPLAGTAAASLPASFQSDEAAARMDVEADEDVDAIPVDAAIPYDRPAPPIRDGGPTLVATTQATTTVSSEPTVFEPSVGWTRVPGVGWQQVPAPAATDSQPE